MVFYYVSGRLAKDTSTQQSLFTGKLSDIQGLTLTLDTLASGTANLAIFENKVQKVSERVTAGGAVSWSPQSASSIIEFYVNYYDANDLPQVTATVST